MPTIQDTCFGHDIWKQREHYGPAYNRIRMLRSENRYDKARTITVRCGNFLQAADYYSKALVARLRASIGSQSIEMLALEKFANNADTQSFNNLARTINWHNYRSFDLIRAIDLALSFDMVLLAKELIQKGNKLFPQDKRLQNASTVLVSHPSVSIRSAKALNLEDSKRWIKKHASEYKGQWIAVHNGILLGAAPTVKELYSQIASDDKTAETIIVKVMA